ncbi:MAG: hypothetical protein NXI01_07915 [Gammaproteobacteria bacterium]|nr:hypothetical protein [Gammaproteobacteria bacterium]
MRWLILTPVLFLLCSCIYTEGEIIEEPEDIAVSPKIYKYTPGYPCRSTNVTDPKRTTICHEPPRLKRRSPCNNPKTQSERE